jgi:hypothetical protein
LEDAMKIYCCGCGHDIDARLTNGAEIYRHRADLADIPIWRCDTCKNYVGCHHKTKNPTQPLGNIPTPEIRAARQHIHKILDPLWKTGPFNRKTIYAMISEKVGYRYHTGEIKSLDEARKIYKIVKEIAA